MEKVRPWCGQPSDQGRLKNRTEQDKYHNIFYCHQNNKANKTRKWTSTWIALSPFRPAVTLTFDFWPLKSNQVIGWD